MRLLPSASLLPPDDRRTDQIRAAARDVTERLTDLNPDRLPISEYTREYLHRATGEIGDQLHEKTFVLAWALAPYGPDEAVTLVDYGGGPGLLSYLASAAGVDTVVYNDIYADACEDVAVVGDRLGLDPDAVVEGDVDAVVDFADRRGVDALASTDVIEHVSDFESFVDGMGRLGEDVTVVHKTAANPLNPLVRRRHHRLHREAEYEADEEEPAYERDDRESNYALRREIVTDHDEELSPPAVDRLAERTRGRVEAEVREAVEAYRDTGDLPREIDHPTNTCNPYTGNWCERLMNPYEVAGQLRQVGFAETRVLPLTYGPSVDSRPKKLASDVLNVLIRHRRRLGLSLSPSYTVYGRTTG